MKGKCAHEGEKKAFLTQTDRRSPTKKAGKSRKKQLVFMKGTSPCWCFELYHASIAGVLSCILLPMSWAVSGFRCWCLELFHASIADVLSCITLLLLMTWAVSRFPSWCLDLCQFSIAVSSILSIAVSFSIFWNKINQFEFRVWGWKISR